MAGATAPALKEGSMTLLLSLMLSAGFADLQEAPSPTGREQEIVVTGEPEARSPLGGVEPPYPEVERIPVGSRIARRVARRPIRSIASESGVAGVFQGDLSHWDGTGGSSLNWRIRLITECVPEHDLVSEEIACILYRVKKSLEVRDFEAAAERLAPLMRRRHLTGWERYYIGYYAYNHAVAVDDGARREAALQLMVASGRMEEAQRREALGALAGMALNSGREATAVERLEQLAELGADARSLANLAALHARAGRMDQARLRMSQAVAQVRQQGQTPAEEWTAFLAGSN
jgi:hypothetical protein